MGLIVLHSGHFSKIFKRLMGTPCSLRWREAGERERLWAVNPSHPILAGLGDRIELPNEEMYGEPFLVPEPLETVLISWFEGGEVFRSGLTYQRGAGRIFYFRPGHETYPTYHDPTVQQLLRNAVHWAHNPAPAWTDVAEGPERPHRQGPGEDHPEGRHPAQARRGGLPVTDAPDAPAPSACSSSAPAPSPAPTPRSSPSSPAASSPPPST